MYLPLRETTPNKYVCISSSALNHERLQLHVDLGNRNLALVGDNGSLFPLGLCEGDCDSDSDCDDHLECFERNGLTPVRGCLGTGVASKDYCKLGY